jgi:hypothetical protein
MAAREDDIGSLRNSSSLDWVTRSTRAIVFRFGEELN